MIYENEGGNEDFDIETFDFGCPITSRMVSFIACTKRNNDTKLIVLSLFAVNSVAWVSPTNGPDLQPRWLALPPLESREPLFDPFVRPTKKRATNSSIKDLQG